MRVSSLCLSVIGLLIPKWSFAADLGKELNVIKFIESSGGINKNHVLITKGIHKGTRAGGAFGLTPITVKELLKSNKTLDKKFPFIKYLTNDQVTEFLNKNEKVDQELASSLWKQLRSKFSAERSACSWLRGPHSAICSDPEQMITDWYVQRFRDGSLEWSVNP